MEAFLGDVSSPAYRHLLLNHLPITGLAAGVIALFIAFFCRSARARIPGLVVILLMSAAALPVLESGEAAYRPIRRIADAAGADWLDAHSDRAGRGAPAFYLLSGLALLALVVPLKWPRLGAFFAGLTLLAAVACLAVGAWIAEAGGRIRHPELRPPAGTSADLTPPLAEP